MDGSMDARMGLDVWNGWMDAETLYKDAGMDEWMDGCMDWCTVWMYGCMDALVHGRMDAWMPGCLGVWLCIHVTDDTTLVP